MDFRTSPPDDAVVRSLASQGLTLAVVDATDRAQFAAWLSADMRGFYDDAPDDRGIDVGVELVSYRRTTGIFDETGPQAEVPIATVSSWPFAMTVPGNGQLDAWAVSSVTVAPTHRRRGLARTMLEQELATARSHGVPIAALTASEATLYGRYGFGAAARAAAYRVAVRRAGWSGAEPSGRAQFVAPSTFADEGREVFERARARSAGDVGLDDLLWGRLVRSIDLHDDAKHMRVVRYVDDEDAAQGFCVYRVRDDADDFTLHTVEVAHLCAATDDALAGLWRYLCTMPLVGTVEARLRPVDDPLPWLVGDQRAVRTTAVSDHLWIRILDVSRALEARTYGAPVRLVLEVDDPLGYAHGSVELRVDDDGRGIVEPLTGAAPEGVSRIALGVSELGSLLLGGVSARTLVRAGRITERVAGSAGAFDAAFATDRAPWLSTWF